MTWNENSPADPHVKIIGKPENVEMAKQMILKVLDTKQKNRVTLKMDVSHSDHSYIIGKGGFKIQQVMEETGCHIHFPDSNRNSNAEKSNQVSIAGEADGVELARNKIRDLLPLVYVFELPNGASAKPGDENGPVMQHIQQTYSFNVSIRAIANGQVLIIVRGCHRLLQRLRCGLILLMEFLTGSKTVPVVGIMKTEIAAQHHSFVTGTNGSNMRSIMNKTGATIHFPPLSTPSNSSALYADARAPPQPSGPPGQGGVGTDVQYERQILRSKTSVMIQGSFDCVCAAWQELLKSLPLALMFDLKEGQDVDSVLINQLMERNSITIMVRPKIRENVKSVIIRGAERDSKILFETRKEILGIQESVRPLNAYGEQTIPLRRNSAPNPEIPAGINEFSTAESLAVLTNLIQQNPDIIGILNNLSAAVPPQNASLNSAAPLMTNGIPHQKMSFPLTYGYHDKQQYDFQGTWAKPSDPKAKNGFHGPSYNQDLGMFFMPPVNRQSPNSPDDTDSGYFSNRSRYNGSSSLPGSSASSTSSLSNEPHESSDATNRRFFSSQNYQNEHKEPSNSDFASLLVEYENKKLSATKAMYEDICGVRTPTTIWSGFGFSKSMPDFVLKGKMPKLPKASSEVDGSRYQQPSDVTAVMQDFQQSLTINGDESGLSDQACALDYSSSVASSNGHAEPSPFSLSNFWEKLPPVSSSVGYNSIRDLQQLFSYFDLEQYTELFIEQEIDLSTFMTLTDCDLQQLNINYCARRRMLNAIAVMRETKKDFSFHQFKAAPGAERKPLFSRMSSSDA